MFDKDCIGAEEIHGVGEGLTKEWSAEEYWL